MKSLKGTKTEKNLMAAFVGESVARNKYTFFAKVAKKEGYEQISAIFLETADNEKEHAKRFFKYLGDAAVEVASVYSSGLNDTVACLKAAACGEHEEWSEIYAKGEREAIEEGFTEIAALFRNIGLVEKHHEDRYLKLAQNIENNVVFNREPGTKWKCRNCGFVYTGADVPEKCPACAHSRAYFELLADNF